MAEGPLGSLAASCAGMRLVKCCPNLRFFWMSSSAFQKAYSSAEEPVVFSPAASFSGAPQGLHACFYEGRQVGLCTLQFCCFSSPQYNFYCQSFDL